MLERAGRLTPTWDASTLRHLSVVHVGDRRTVLALDLMGGSASLATDALPAGGRFEFIGSDGINSVSLQRPR